MTDPVNPATAPDQWTAEKKTTLVAKILLGIDTIPEAAARFGLKAGEIENWKASFLKTFDRAAADLKPALAQEEKKAIQLQRAYQSVQRTELGLLEVSMLIPLLRGQLQYLDEIFESIKKKAEDPEVAKDIAIPLSQLIARPTQDPNADARDYLQRVAKQCDSDFRQPIRVALKQADLIVDVRSLSEWLVRVRIICSSITRNKSLLFWLSLRSFVTGRNTQTGKTFTRPVEFAAITFPFDVHVEEASRIAEAVDGTASTWQDDLRESRNRLLEFKTALSGQKGSRNLLFFEGLIIILSVLMIFVGFLLQDFVTGRRQIRALEGEKAEVVLKEQAAGHRIAELEAALAESRKGGSKPEAPPPAKVEPQKPRPPLKPQKDESQKMRQ